MPRAVSITEVLAKIDAQCGDRVTMLGEYRGTNTPTLFRCNGCGREAMQTPTQHMYRSRGGCPICSAQEKSKRSSNDRRENTLRAIFEKHGDSLEVLGEYSTQNTPVLIRCNVCRNKWKTRLSRVVLGGGCPKCFFKRASDEKRTSLEEYRRQLAESWGSDIRVTSYTQMKAQAEFVCKCGHKWKTRAAVVVKPRRTGCPKCAGQWRMTQDEFIAESKRVHGEEAFEYSLVKYVGVAKLVRLVCKECKKEFSAQPARHINRFVGCPNCKASSGERRVSDCLIAIGVQFEIQKTFRSCKHKKSLRFDFFVPRRTLLEADTLIEYDGMQHEQPIGGFFGGDAQLVLRKQRDAIKDSFANDKGFRLLRIPYHQYPQIQSILETAFPI